MQSSNPTRNYRKKIPIQLLKDSSFARACECRLETCRSLGTEKRSDTDCYVKGFITK